MVLNRLVAIFPYACRVLAFVSVAALLQVPVPLIAAAAETSPAAKPKPAEPGDFKSLDTRIQDLKKDVLDLNRDLFVLEEELQVKADILRLLTQSENVVNRGLFSQEDYDLGRFMICAWVDEAILNSSWNQKNLWQREQLQRLYYHTLDAGEEAFERLNALGLHQREVVRSTISAWPLDSWVAIITKETSISSNR